MCKRICTVMCHEHLDSSKGAAPRCSRPKIRPSPTQRCSPQIPRIQIARLGWHAAGSNPPVQGSHKRQRGPAADMSASTEQDKGNTGHLRDTHHRYRAMLGSRVFVSENAACRCDTPNPQRFPPRTKAELTGGISGSRLGTKRIRVCNWRNKGV